MKRKIEIIVCLLFVAIFAMAQTFNSADIIRGRKSIHTDFAITASTNWPPTFAAIGLGNTNNGWLAWSNGVWWSGRWTAASNAEYVMHLDGAGGSSGTTTTNLVGDSNVVVTANGPTNLLSLANNITVPGTLTAGSVSNAAIIVSGNNLFGAETKLQWQPNYAISTNSKFGTGFVSPNSSSSTFSAWGEGVGVVTNSFSALMLGIYPFNATNVPTELLVRVRIQGVDWQTNGNALSSGNTNPSTWTIIASGQSTNFILNSRATNLVVIPLTANVVNTNKLWVEVIGNGFFGALNPNSGTTGVTNAEFVALPAYLTGGLLSSTNWTTTSGVGFQFAVNFGDITSFSDYTLLPGFKAKIAASLSATTISLPTNVFAVEGLEANWYWENIIRSDLPLSSLTVDVSGSYGQQFADFYRITPALTNSGTNAMSFTVSNGTNTLATWSGNLIIASNAQSVGVSRKLLVIGDSTTSGGQVVTEIVRMAGTNGFSVEGIGTQGTSTNKHEGRSGWTFANFHSGSGSPFTNGGTFNFNYYLTNNSLSMTSGDWVIFNLGINDNFSWSSDAAARGGIAAQMLLFTNMLNSVTNTVQGVRVGLGCIIPPSQSQDSFAANYANEQTLWRYNRNRFLFNENLMANSYGATIIPINASLDSVNNMQVSTSQLNLRNTNLWVYQSNGVHPDTSGYMQISDTIYSVLKWFR